jgi:hypothetical protein
MGLALGPQFSLAHSTQMLLKALQFLLCVRLGLTQRERRASDMVKWKLLPNCRKEIGSGLPYVSLCPTVFCSLLSIPGMMPEDSVYGPWPASGEIDIMESRGNDVSYNVDGQDRGRDVYSSTLHWGSYIIHSQLQEF